MILSVLTGIGQSEGVVSMKTALIVIGIVLFVAMIVFLWLLIAGADQSRKSDIERKEKRDDLHRGG